MASETQNLIPPHHARRPMNAFLIFCKRHRNVVKGHYPNLENRCITKILGEWWASLDSIEKSAYTELAKQYKDAFFTANPDFKWYKLPAPSLRMLSTRPETITNFSSYYNNASDNMMTNISEENYENLKCQKMDEDEEEKYIAVNNLLDSENDIKIQEEEECQNMFSPTKLADETQLGGLRNLIDVGPGFYNNNGNNECNKNCSKSIKKNSQMNNNVSDDEDLYAYEHNYKAQELEHALQEANSFIVNVFDEHCAVANSHSYTYDGPKINSKQFNIIEHCKQSHDELERNTKQGIKTDLGDQQTNLHNCLASNYNSNGIHDGGCDLYLREKSSRSCKGKRYEEFKNKGLINRKPKYSPVNKSSIYIDHNNEDLLKTEKDNVGIANSESNMFGNIHAIECINNANDGVMGDFNKNVKQPEYFKPMEFRPTESKFFHPSDFDLDSKIQALPLLNLNEYLLKKKENKNIRKQIKKHGVKQKINEIDHKIKPYSLNKVKTKYGAELRNMSQNFEKETLIGSRKRKAIKQRITHLELNKSNTCDMKPKNMPSYPNNYLCDLSTLAEVAAKSSKITTTLESL